MINNDTLFTHFRSARRQGRSGWARPIGTVRVTIPAPLPEPPAERITETDILDPDAHWFETSECVYCGRTDEHWFMVRLTDDPTADDWAHYTCLKAEQDD